MKGVTMHWTTCACSDKVMRDGALIYNLCLFHVFICALLLFLRTLLSHRDKELSCCFVGQQVWTGSERYHKVVNTRWVRQGRTSWITESPRLCSRWTKKSSKDRDGAFRLLGFLQVQIEGNIKGWKVLNALWHICCRFHYCQNVMFAVLLLTIK